MKTLLNEAQFLALYCWLHFTSSNGYLSLVDSVFTEAFGQKHSFNAAAQFFHISYMGVRI